MKKWPEPQKEVFYVVKERARLKIAEVGNLKFPEGSAEAQRCKDIGTILHNYSALTDVSKPLSIAVFGPPGSGKSRCVEEIAKSLGKRYTELKVVNISQLSETKELVRAIEEGMKLRTKELTPIFFFDEFDAPCSGTSLGWLRWFLAPMQDGNILEDGGRTIEIGKAVFMFAGGTAISLAEFEERARLDEVAFREKKVPDFISRLRGFIDIQGINSQNSERKVRRAILLRYFLNKRWSDKRDSSGRLPIDPRVVDSLLSNVHYLHGVRSMEALIEMSMLKDGEIQIPKTDLTTLHLSRGVLDGKLIGISAGLKQDMVGDLLAEITDALLRDGAKLAYGGDFEEDGTLHKIVQAAQDAPADLFDRDKNRIRNYLGFPSSLRKEVKHALKTYKATIDFEVLETLSSQEIKDLNLKDNQWFSAWPLGATDTYQSNHHLAWAISLFRMRVRLTQDIDALIVFGGKDGESWGRLPGIAEEVMLALALGKPVYIMGGLGGAASAVGKLLGLGETIANPDECLKDVKPMTALCPPKFRRAFALPNQQLPETIEELRDYLFRHSLTTDKWLWNGLSSEENRELFCADVSSPHSDVPSPRSKCVDIIVKGLSRLHWKGPASRQQH
jgi:hypothetical protein